MDYTHYSVEDFITDEKFIQWVQNPDSKNTLFWESWVQTHPEKKQEIEEARQIVLMMDFNYEEMDEERLNEIKAKIHRRTGTKDYHSNKGPNDVKIKEEKILPFTHKWYWVAACLAAVLMIGFTLLFFTDHEQRRVYTTGYGETKSFFLPDSSNVTLNANSELVVLNGKWKDQTTRAVKLNGEAFFKVRKSNSNNGEKARKFIVHSGNVEVEVLGTQFNVNHRRNRTQVVLTEGRVQLNKVDEGALQNLIMDPGEMAEYSKENEKITKKLVDTEVYTSWRNNKLVFDNTPLKEIALMIEENYGYAVEIVDEGLEDRKLTAQLPTTELPVLLKTLEATFKINVVQNKNTIQFKNK